MEKPVNNNRRFCSGWIPRSRARPADQGRSFPRASWKAQVFARKSTNQWNYKMEPLSDGAATS
jgi:hypothetical protein